MADQPRRKTKTMKTKKTNKPTGKTPQQMTDSPISSLVTNDWMELKNGTRWTFGGWIIFSWPNFKCLFWENEWPNFNMDEASADAVNVTLHLIRFFPFFPSSRDSTVQIRLLLLLHLMTFHHSQATRCAMILFNSSSWNKMTLINSLVAHTTNPTNQHTQQTGDRDDYATLSTCRELLRLHITCSFSNSFFLCPLSRFSF